MEKASPGADAVKVESKTHVYLALDYTDEDKPKLLTLEEVSSLSHHIIHFRLSDSTMAMALNGSQLRTVLLF